MRALSQCLASEFQPLGVHVAHVIIDGVVGPPRFVNFFFFFSISLLGTEKLAIMRDVGNMYIHVYAHHFLPTFVPTKQTKRL